MRGLNVRPRSTALPELTPRSWPPSLLDVFEAHLFGGARSPLGRREPDGGLGVLPFPEPLAQVVRGLADQLGLSLDLLDELVLARAESGVTAEVSTLAVLVRALGLPERVGALLLAGGRGAGLDALATAAARVGSGQRDLVLVGAAAGPWLRGAPTPSLERVDPKLEGDEAWIEDRLAADVSAWRAGLDAAALESWARASRSRIDTTIDPGSAPWLVPMLDGSGLEVLTRDEVIPEAPESPPAPHSEAAVERALSASPELSAGEALHQGLTMAAPMEGASALLVGSRHGGEQAGLTERARLAGFESRGSGPGYFADGQDAVVALLDRAGISVEDVDAWEVNETFAAIPVAFARGLGLSRERVNARGGCLGRGDAGAAGALASAARLVARLEERDGRFGVAAALERGRATVVLVQR